MTEAAGAGRCATGCGWSVLVREHDAKRLGLFYVDLLLGRSKVLLRQYWAILGPPPLIKD